MSRNLQLALMAALCVFRATTASAEVDYKIVTASERGTYIQIGRDLARFVAPQADISLDVLPSAGSAHSDQIPSVRARKTSAIFNGADPSSARSSWFWSRERVSAARH